MILPNMGKSNILKVIVAIIAIVVLAIAVVSINKMISPKQNVVEESIKQVSGGAVIDYGNCFSDSLDTVVFVYSNSCPYCNNMKPLIQELESEGYKFYWAEGSDVEARNVINNCFSDIVGGYVPQFICPATGVEVTGAMSKDALRQFADGCAKVLKI